LPEFEIFGGAVVVGEFSVARDFAGEIENGFLRGFPEGGRAGFDQSAAQMTAPQAASGRRAHQMWSVEMWPCRIDFSRLACAEMR